MRATILESRVSGIYFRDLSAGVAHPTGAVTVIGMAIADELQRRIRFTRAQGMTKTADLYQEAADRGAALRESEGLTTAEMIVETMQIALLIKEADEMLSRAALNQQAHL